MVRDDALEDSSELLRSLVPEGTKRRIIEVINDIVLLSSFLKLVRARN